MTFSGLKKRVVVVVVGVIGELVAVAASMSEVLVHCSPAPIVS